MRAFGLGYFRDFALVLEPRHIGASPKDTPFWPRLSPKAIKSIFCLGSERTEAIGVQYFFLNKKFRRTFGLGYGMNRGHIPTFGLGFGKNQGLFCYFVFKINFLFYCDSHI